MNFSSLKELQHKSAAFFPQILLFILTYDSYTVTSSCLQTSGVIKCEWKPGNLYDGCMTLTLLWCGEITSAVLYSCDTQPARLPKLTEVLRCANQLFLKHINWQVILRKRVLITFHYITGIPYNVKKYYIEINCFINESI